MISIFELIFRMNRSALIQSLRNINEIMHNLMNSNKLLFFKGRKIETVEEIKAYIF